MLDCEYLVIGAGQTGMTVVAGLAEKDKKVILVDQNKIGGSFIFTDETPKYLLRDQANIFARSLEVLKDNPDTFPVLMEYRQKIGKIIAKSIHAKQKEWEKFFARYKKVRLIVGTAEFLSKSLVEVNSETERHLINFKNCVIATGKDQLVKPNIQGLEEVDFFYKDGSFLFEHIPSQIALIGLNSETLEVAALYADLGIKVDIMDKHKDLASAFSEIDKSIVNFYFQKLFAKQVDLHFNFDVKEVSKNKKGEVTLKNKEGKSKNFPQIYLSLKESFSGKSLSLNKIGVKSSKNGINTDYFGRTTQGHIYALGECSNKTTLRSKHFMVQEYLYPQSRKVDISKLINQKPLGLETDYFYAHAQAPIFSIGMGEDKAVHVHGNSAKKVVIRSAHGDGFAKIIYRDVTGKMLGAALAGEICEEGRVYLLEAFLTNKSYLEVAKQLQILVSLQ